MLVTMAQKKISNAYIVQDHFKKACELNPADATSRHLMGRWCWAFAELSYMEKKVAGLVFGTPPESSYDEALDNFVRAEVGWFGQNGLNRAQECDPGFWIRNRLMIAKCLIKLKRQDEARPWLERAATAVPPRTDDDHAAVAEAKKLLGR